MNRTSKMVLALVAAAVLSGPLWADAVGEKRKAQNKLLAQRAARVDAMRKLAERINGLMITSETSVRDFVATDDRISTAMQSWLRGAKEVGEPNYTPDGICEVTMEVTLQEVVTELKQLHKEYYRGNKVAREDFDQITVNTTEKTLRETGSGAPRPEFDDRGQTVAPGASGQDIMSAKAWEYWMANTMPQGRLMAQRAAHVDGLRKLGERISGLMITSETSVRDFVATDDRINTAMQTFIQGAREVGTRYHDNELICEVEIEVTLQEVIANLQAWHKEYYRGNQVASQDFQKLTLQVNDKDVRETGMGVPPEKYLKDLPPAAAAAVEFGGVNWPGTARAVGQAAIDAENANAAQAKLMAQRGAELDARRKLAEQLDGLVVTSSTTVKDFVAQSDDIHTAMMTFQEGAHVVEGSTNYLPDGTCQVTVEIDLDPLRNMVLYYQEKLAVVR